MTLCVLLTQTQKSSKLVTDKRGNGLFYYKHVLLQYVDTFPDKYVLSSYVSTP